MISVIMPVYNAEKYLIYSIESILNQSFGDFEFLIFDDGSNDKSKEIIAKYSNQDKRIKFYNNNINMGYSHIINKTLLHVKHNFIARMDADDISEIDRLEKQYNFLKANNQYSVVGSYIKIIDKDNKLIRKSSYPIENKDIKNKLHKFSTFAHPSTMINFYYLKKVGFYRPMFEPAEDYDLWTRLSVISKLKNLPEYLLKYRQHTSSVSMKRSDEQQIKTFFIQKNFSYLENGMDLIYEKNIQNIDLKTCKKLFGDFTKIDLGIKFGKLQYYLSNRNYLRFILHFLLMLSINPLYSLKRIYSFYIKNLKKI